MATSHSRTLQFTPAEARSLPSGEKANGLRQSIPSRMRLRGTCSNSQSLRIQSCHRPAAARLAPLAGVRSGRWFHLTAVAAAQQVAGLASCVLVPALAGYEGHPSTPAKTRGILGTHAYSGGFQSWSGAKKAGKSNRSAPVLLASVERTEVNIFRPLTMILVQFGFQPGPPWHSQVAALTALLPFPVEFATARFLGNTEGYPPRRTV